MKYIKLDRPICNTVHIYINKEVTVTLFKYATIRNPDPRWFKAYRKFMIQEVSFMPFIYDL